MRKLGFNARAQIAAWAAEQEAGRAGGVRDDRSIKDRETAR
jgi:hypothetical protein